MSEKRYFIYISTSCYEDVLQERLKLENTLIPLGIFPWDFKERRTSLNTALARRQIDDCDYMIFLLGGSYGDLSASGISYMHLDFLYALNKQKTIISLIDATPESRESFAKQTNPELIKKFHAFRDQLRLESRYCHMFTSPLDLATSARNLLNKAVREVPSTGWVRPQPNDVLHNEIQRLKQKISNMEQAESRLNATPANGTKLTVSQAPSRSDQFNVSYRTQAYQDGNLQDLQLFRAMTWIQVLHVLAPHFKEESSEQNFQRVLNQYLEESALADVHKNLPRAHAVARTQIDSRSLQQIKLQMKWNNWIIPKHDSDTSTRITWQLTSEGQKTLERNP